MITKLKQQFPFSMIDRIISIEPGKIQGIKKLSNNDIYRNMISNFVVLEVMGQLSEIMLRNTYKESHGKVFLAAIPHVKFNIKNMTEDTISITSILKESFNGFYKTHTTAAFGKELIADATFVHCFINK